MGSRPSQPLRFVTKKGKTMSSSTSIGRALRLSDTYSVGGTQALGSVSGVQGDAEGDDLKAGAVRNPASSVDISKPAQLFNKLKQLQTSDPTKFKQVTAQLADKLQKAADNSTGDDQKLLSDLASKFKEASQIGELSLPQGPDRGSGRPQGIKSTLGQGAGISQTQASGKHKSHGHHHISDKTKETLDSILNNLGSSLTNTSATATSVTETAA